MFSSGQSAEPMAGKWWALLVLLLLGGCAAPRDLVVLLPEDNGAIGKAIVTGTGGSAELDRPLSATETGPGAHPGRVYAMTRAQVQASFGGALAALPPAPQHFLVYFANDRPTPLRSSRNALAAAASAATAQPHADVSVVGHADTTGPETRNVGLSLRRATKVRNALLAAGVPAASISIDHRGSSNPRVPTAPGVPQPLNRRVEITIR